MPGRAGHGTYMRDLGRRHPFEVTMLFSALVVGFSHVLAPTPGSLERTLPGALVTTWYVLLGLGALTGLFGVFWREPIGGLLIERSAMISLSAAGFVYSITLLSVGGLRAVPAASFVFGFALASLLRTVDVSRILVRIRGIDIARETLFRETGEDDKGR